MPSGKMKILLLLLLQDGDNIGGREGQQGSLRQLEDDVEVQLGRTPAQCEAWVQDFVH